MSLILVENSYEPPISREAFVQGDEGLHKCMDVRGIRWVRSFLSPDGTRSVCHFEADDAETVREAFRSSGVPFGRVWAAEMIEA
jgi:hypothetical protein